MAIFLTLTHCFDGIVAVVQLPSRPANLKERLKLPMQQGPGRSPGQKQVLVH